MCSFQKKEHLYFSRRTQRPLLLPRLAPLLHCLLPPPGDQHHWDATGARLAGSHRRHEPVRVPPHLGAAESGLGRSYFPLFGDFRTFQSLGLQKCTWYRSSMTPRPRCSMQSWNVWKANTFWIHFCLKKTQPVQINHWGRHMPPVIHFFVPFTM